MVEEDFNSSDVDRLNALPLWHATRAWAEELLRGALALESAKEVLTAPNRGRHRIPGTTWFYRTHGVGVDVNRGSSSGGIDFDFDSADPDLWRLHRFAEKQLNAGNISADEYWGLVDDKERFERAGTQVLAGIARTRA